MSTLQAVSLKHPTAVSNNIVLDSSGNATVANNVTVTGTGSIGGNFSFNSGYGSSAVAYGCRAWVNFNGTGTVAIRTSGNVSSITDNGVGSYTINFAASLVDANYAVGFLAQNNSGGNADEPMVCGIYGGITPTTSGFRTAFRRLAASGGTLADTEIATFAVFR